MEPIMLEHPQDFVSSVSNFPIAERALFSPLGYGENGPNYLCIETKPSLVDPLKELECVKQLQWEICNQIQCGDSNITRNSRDVECIAKLVTLLSAWDLPDVQFEALYLIELMARSSNTNQIHLLLQHDTAKLLVRLLVSSNWNLRLTAAYTIGILSQFSEKLCDEIFKCENLEFFLQFLLSRQDDPLESLIVSRIVMHVLVILTNVKVESMRRALNEVSMPSFCIDVMAWIGLLQTMVTFLTYPDFDVVKNACTVIENLCAFVNIIQQQDCPLTPIGNPYINCLKTEIDAGFVGGGFCHILVNILDGTTSLKGSQQYAVQIAALEVLITIITYAQSENIQKLIEYGIFQKLEKTILMSLLANGPCTKVACKLLSQIIKIVPQFSLDLIMQTKLLSVFLNLLFNTTDYEVMNIIVGIVHEITVIKGSFDIKNICRNDFIYALCYVLRRCIDQYTYLKKAIYLGATSTIMILDERENDYLGTVNEKNHNEAHCRTESINKQNEIDGSPQNHPMLLNSKAEETLSISSIDKKNMEETIYTALATINSFLHRDECVNIVKDNLPYEQQYYMLCTTFDEEGGNEILKSLQEKCSDSERIFFLAKNMQSFFFEKDHLEELEDAMISDLDSSNSGSEQTTRCSTSSEGAGMLPNSYRKVKETHFEKQVLQEKLLPNNDQSEFSNVKARIGFPEALSLVCSGNYSAQEEKKDGKALQTVTSMAVLNSRLPPLEPKCRLKSTFMQNNANFIGDTCLLSSLSQDGKIVAADDGAPLKRFKDNRYETPRCTSCIYKFKKIGIQHFSNNIICKFCSLVNSVLMELGKNRTNYEHLVRMLIAMLNQAQKDVNVLRDCSIPVLEKLDYITTDEMLLKIENDRSLSRTADGSFIALCNEPKSLTGGGGGAYYYIGSDGRHHHCDNRRQLIEQQQRNFVESDVVCKCMLYSLVTKNMPSHVEMRGARTSSIKKMQPWITEQIRCSREKCIDSMRMLKIWGFFICNSNDWTLLYVTPCPLSKEVNAIIKEAKLHANCS